MYHLLTATNRKDSPTFKSIRTAYSTTRCSKWHAFHCTMVHAWASGVKVRFSHSDIILANHCQELMNDITLVYVGTCTKWLNCTFSVRHLWLQISSLLNTFLDNHSQKSWPSLKRTAHIIKQNMSKDQQNNTVIQLSHLPVECQRWQYYWCRPPWHHSEQRHQLLSQRTAKGLTQAR